MSVDHKSQSPLHYTTLHHHSQPTHQEKKNCEANLAHRIARFTNPPRPTTQPNYTQYPSHKDTFFIAVKTESFGRKETQKRGKWLVRQSGKHRTAGPDLELFHHVT